MTPGCFEISLTESYAWHRMVSTRAGDSESGFHESLPVLVLLLAHRFQVALDAVQPMDAQLKRLPWRDGWLKPAASIVEPMLIGKAVDCAR